ncbi:MAG TPA: NADH-quinone oxidoreductase subunit C [Candidatus Limnocylindrales bacterium]|nr:NADH-quinone oxidoreductase subunit C [Candidatus Limnocylindrales bacterium]
MALDASELAARIARGVDASAARPFETRESPGIEVASASVAEVLRFLRDELGYELFVDITAVDYEALHGTIEIIYIVRSLKDAGKVVVKAVLDARDPHVPTAAGIFAGANWAEREVFDMFGVRFDGHPDLRRILMYPEFEGHPLRKSYAYQHRQSLVPERDPIAEPWPRRRAVPAPSQK